MDLGTESFFKESDGRLLTQGISVAAHLSLGGRRTVNIRHLESQPENACFTHPALTILLLILETGFVNITISSNSERSTIFVYGGDIEKGIHVEQKSFVLSQLFPSHSQPFDHETMLLVLIPNRAPAPN
jgi:hypothetical protein